jgi:hypothetical protein
MTVSVINNGVETQLDDGAFVELVGHDGWGMPPNHRLTIRGPEQHGETDYGYRLDPRIGKLLFMFPDAELADMYAHRDQLRQLFKPQANQIIKWVNPDGSVRYFDGHLAGDIAVPWSVKNWAAQQATVLFKVENGYCYDPVGKTQTFAYGAGAMPFDIPFVIPFGIGGSSINQTNTFAYNGEWPSFPQIIATGPITNLLMTHQQSGLKIQLKAGTTINAGDRFTFDLRYGYKTVIDASGNRQNSTLTDDSGLAHFAILDADSGAPGGNNSINVQGSGITAATEIDINYFENYLGR